MLAAASAITDTVHNVIDRSTEADIVIHSDDAAEIDAITDRLAALNDDLMRYVDGS